MYWRVLKKRLKDEGNETVTNCNGLKMLADDGKMRMTDEAYKEQLFSLNPFPRPKPNHSNPLIDEINKLENEYLNLKAKKVHAEFTNKDLTKLKTQDEVFQQYIAHLKKKIAEEAQNATNANASQRSKPLNQLMIKKEEKTKN